MWLLLGKSYPLKEHIFLVHKKDQKYVSDKIGHANVEDGNPKNLMNSQYEHQIGLKCLECKYFLRLKASLISYAQSVHRKEKRYQCDECEYSSFKKQMVKLHEAFFKKC